MHLKTIAAALLAVLLAGCGLVPDYSSGSRVGVVTKFSKKGLLYPSWEGELAMDAWRIRQGGGAANVWTFSVTDPSTARDLEVAMQTGRPLRLHYRQWLIKPISQDTPTSVNRVEVVKGSANAE